MNPLEAGKAAIEAICRPLREERQTLTSRIQEIDAVLEPLEIALKPLDGNSGLKKLRSKVSTKATVNQENVRRVMLKVVTAKPGIDQHTLEEKAKQILKEQLGLDLKGYVNRCREVLGSEPFVITADGRVHVKNPTEATTERPETQVTRYDSQMPVERSTSGFETR